MGDDADVFDRIAELEEEVRHLRRVESLGLLTASVVHDFNNLLTPILCLTTLLGRETPRGTHAASLVGEIQSAAERAKLLARQVLSLARKRPPRVDRVDIGGMVGEIRGLLERVIGEEIELLVAIDDGLPDTMLDREQLEHVLLNLSVNARDAMPRGGRLTLAATTVTIDEDGQPREYVRLSLTDNGEGISLEVRERMFERFFTTKEDGAGTGLGLAAAQRFVEESRGKIEVQSEPGHGTEVALLLPRAARRELPTIPAGPRRDPPRGGETVLVVDDDEHVRRAIRAVLEERGYRVLDTSSAGLPPPSQPEALPSIDLVLVDPGARRSPTRPWLERLRQSDVPPRILLMSGQTDDRVSDLLVEGAPLLRKAFSHEDLAVGVRAALDVPALE